MIFASSYLSYKAIIGTLGTMHNVHQGGRKQILDGKATVDRKNLITYRVSDMEKVDFVAQLPRTYIHFDTFQGVILYDLLLHLFFWENFWNLSR